MASFSVVSNISSTNAQANLNTTNIGLQKALERLSSGYRINKSGDDAAGLVVANSYRSEQAVLTQGVRNAGDGLSTLQIKDGALNNISTLGAAQATVGTLENRLQFAITLAQSQIVNTKAAESRIRDANIAEESANMTRYSILNQAGIAALAQANQQSGAVLSLLR